MSHELRCADCSQPVGLIRVMKGDIRPGHLRQPDPIHPVRLAPAARNAAIPVAATGQPEGSDNRDAARRSLGRGVQPASTASDRSIPPRTSPSPSRRRVEAVPSPRTASAPAPSAGALTGRLGRS